MTWMLVVAGIGLVLFLLDQLALWAERRGWLYWRKRKPLLDAASAAIILQDYLDAHASPTPVQSEDEDR